MSKKLNQFYVLFFVITLFFIPKASRALGVEIEAVSIVSQAEASLEAAYLSVLEAERMGVDINELVALLNKALAYYSEAERALDSGEHEIAVGLADKVVEASNIVLEADTSLIVVAKHVEEATFRNQVYRSFGAICLIVFLGYLGWRLFKSYYLRKATRLESEVAAIGS